ncbi:MAG TPA: hypothetical protein VFE42_20160, partial [Chloroflexota bacterium]|nr:hypothetical protein [Chloroflexota bacterium]
MRRARRLAALLAIAAILPWSASAPHTAAVDPGDNHVHDPMMVRQGRTYYVFFTGGGLQIITSTNMMTWHYAGT